MVQHLAVMVGNQIRGHYVSDGVQACVFVQSDTRREAESIDKLSEIELQQHSVLLL